MENSRIQWCHSTFNGWIGCSHKPKHPGCAHCYAEAEQADRRGRVVWGPKGTRSMTRPEYWMNPLRWNGLAKSTGRRKRVFAFSLADIFEKWNGWVTQKWTEDGKHHQRMITMDQARRELFQLIDATQYLDWLLLTKRPENVWDMWPEPHGVVHHNVSTRYRRKNVWLGTSISDQVTADQYIPELLKLRGLAPVLFVSAEPLLSQVDLTNILLPGPGKKSPTLNALEGRVYHEDGVTRDASLDWLIVGGESGSKARPFNLQWGRDLISQCTTADVPVPVFMKQVGSNPQEENVYTPSDSNEPEKVTRFHKMKDKKGGNPDEWPAALRVREIPHINRRDYL